MKDKKLPKQTDDNRNRQTEDPEGYPLYPPKDDIYNRFKEEQDIDPENPSQLKEPLDPDAGAEGEEELIIPDLHTDDLDIPGADLDDDLEEIGSEDEENNYYSIGGDNHHNLEEDNID